MPLRTQLNILLVLITLGLFFRGYAQYRVVEGISTDYDIALEKASTSLVQIAQIQAESDKVQNEAVSILLLQSIGEEEDDQEEIEEEIEELDEGLEALEALILSYQDSANDPALAAALLEVKALLQNDVDTLQALLQANAPASDLLEAKEALETTEETFRELTDQAAQGELAASDTAQTQAENAAQNALNTLAVSVALSLLVPFLFNWLLSRYFLSPINRLDTAAQQLQTGSWDVNLPEAPKNELGTLAKTFNQMARTLQERDRALTDINASLEKQVAERTQELEGKVQELNQTMRFRDDFLAVMSHELRTPMNAIMGYSTFALMNEKVEPDLKNMLERIVVNSEGLLSLINSILDISRINSGRIQLVSEPFSPKQLAQGWHDDFRPQAEAKGLAFEFQCAEDLPQILVGDEERISQIVKNLLVNAIKFTNTGKISLRVAYLENTHLKLEVQDSGIGIPETWQNLIFEEFRQVDMSSKRNHEGVGLGLSIVQKLANLMGGKVALDSQVGVGSHFTVNIPLKAEG